MLQQELSIRMFCQRSCSARSCLDSPAGEVGSEKDVSSWQKRHREGSSPLRSPMEFAPISIAARTQCHKTAGSQYSVYVCSSVQAKPQQVNEMDWRCGYSSNRPAPCADCTGYIAPRNSTSLAVWSSGMTLASGARGPGLNSRNSPFRPSMDLCCICSLRSQQIYIYIYIYIYRSVAARALEQFSTAACGFCFLLPYVLIDSPCQSCWVFLENLGAPGIFGYFSGLAKNRRVCSAKSELWQTGCRGCSVMSEIGRNMARNWFQSGARLAALRRDVWPLIGVRRAKLECRAWLLRHGRESTADLANPHRS
jgi:hypothetical protein